MIHCPRRFCARSPITLSSLRAARSHARGRSATIRRAEIIETGGRSRPWRKSRAREFSEQFKELVTQNEQRMKAIQEQIAGQWSLSGPGDRGPDRAAVEGPAEGARGPDRAATERQDRRPLGGSAEGDHRSGRAAVERPTESDHGPGGTAVGRPKKAIEDAQNAIGGVFRRKPE